MGGGLIWRVALIAITAMPVLAQGALLVPTGWGGELGYDWRQSRYEGGFESTSQMVTGRINTEAYLWQPWFVTMGISLAVSREQSSTNNGVDSASNITTGAFMMNALPSSRFPFTAIYSVSDSRVDSTTANDNPLLARSTARQFTRSTLQLMQGYKSRSYNLNFRYNTDEAESDGGERYLQEGYGIDYSAHFNKQNLSANATVSNQSNNQNSNESDNSVLTLNHNYYPDNYTSVDSIASHVKSNNFYTFDMTGFTQQMTSTIDQASSSIGWQSDKRPLRINGGVRVHRLDYQTETTTATTAARSEGLHATIGGSYQFGERMFGSAGSRYSVMRNDGSDVRSHGEDLTLGYSSARSEFGEYDYGWNSSVSGSHQQSEGSRADAAGLALGHNLNRRWRMDDRSSLSLSLGQDLSESYTRTNGSSTTVSLTGVNGHTRRLGHNLSFGWSRSDPSGSTLAQFTLSDSRGVVGDESRSQLINAQLSRSQVIDNRSSLNGNLTWQAWHYMVPGVPDYGVGQTSSAGASYRYARPFTLQRVTFTSEVRMSDHQPAYGPSMQEYYWDNRFTHEIGLLRSSLGLTYRDHMGIQSTMLMFSLKRIF